MKVVYASSDFEYLSSKLALMDEDTRSQFNKGPGRALIVSCFLRGMSYAETARVTGFSSAHVYNTAFVVCRWIDKVLEQRVAASAAMGVDECADVLRTAGSPANGNTGKSYLSGWLVRCLLSLTAEQMCRVPMSPRKAELVTYMLSGLTARETAAAMGCHYGNVVAKAGVILDDISRITGRTDYGAWRKYFDDEAETERLAKSPYAMYTKKYLAPFDGEPVDLTYLIDRMQLGVRTSRCLKNNGIIELGDLVTKTEANLLGYDSFGRKCLNEVKGVLEHMGLSLGMVLDDAC